MNTTTDGCPPPLQPSHKELISTAWPMVSRIVRAAQHEKGVEADAVFVVLIDLRGAAGQGIASWIYGEVAVASRLARAGMDHPVPLAVPLSPEDGATVIAELAPELAFAFAMRAPGVPILVFDAKDVAALAFRPSSSLTGEA